MVAEYGSRSKGIRPAQWRLYWDDLADVWVDLPSLDEQRRIANFLDAEVTRIDKLVEFRQRQRRVLKDKFKSVWGAAILDFEASSWLPLRRLLTAITDGPFGSALTSDHYSDEGARVIRLGNIGEARFRDADAAYISEEYFQDLRRHEALAGDLIIAGLGDENHPLGRACVVPALTGHAIVKADCFRVRLDQRRIMHEYAAWALSSPPVSTQVAELSRGATRARINLSVARAISIPVPTLAQQARLVTSLSAERLAIDEVVAVFAKQLDILTERRQALIAAAVTGQLDVTTARGLAQSGDVA